MIFKIILDVIKINHVLNNCLITQLLKVLKTIVIQLKKGT